MPEEKRPPARLSRRTLLKAGVGVTAAAGLSAVGIRPAEAGLDNRIEANASLVRQFTGTGPKETARFSAPYVDLCIPVRVGDHILYVGGDTYGAAGPNPIDPNNDWRTPVGLICDLPDPDPQQEGTYITGAIHDSLDEDYAIAFVDADGARLDAGHPDGRTTTLPSDVFVANGALYLHLMRGALHQTVQSELWKSTDEGQTWRRVRTWAGDAYDSRFQQKTYAAETAASDPYIYVMTSLFNREVVTDLLLFRVRKTDLDLPDSGPDGYEPWGYQDGSWGWGKAPTSINQRRQWGEICFRAMGGKYALSWFQPNNIDHSLEDIRAQVFDLPTSDLVATPEQTMVYQTDQNGTKPEYSVLPALYGGFILPGSTFGNFNIIVSRWDQNDSYAADDNYCCLQYSTSLKV